MKLNLSISQSKIARITIFFFAAFMTISTFVQAQDETVTDKPKPVTRTFRGPQLINMPTNEIIDGLTFGIQHRFGQIIPKDILYNFLGIDLSANIRFSLAYPIIKDRLMVEIGRTKTGKNLDLELKYQVLMQTEKNEMPVSVAIYVNPSLSSEKFSPPPSYAFFADSLTPFENKFAHRLAYHYQIVIARKFSKKFSLQLEPVFIYKNLVEVGKENLTTAIQAGTRFKFSKKGSIMAEYGYAFNNRDTSTVNPLSIGVEFSTVGHVFQLVASSSSDLLARDIYTSNNANFLKGNFFLGFNMKRFF